MTRKQAIYQAIQALSVQGGQDEAISLLKDIYDELPLVHWSDKSIRDTVEQFIIDNGKVPTASDFRKKAMPSHPVIKQKYKITLGEWLQINYPTPKPDKQAIYKKRTQNFIDDYIRIKPVTSDDFNKRRSPNVKTWNSIANYNEVKSWNELLDILSLPSYSKKRKTKHRGAFEVSITTDRDFFNEYIKKHSS